MVQVTVYSVTYFAVAIFLAMFSVSVVNDIPLDLGLGFVIAGISGMLLAIMQAEKSLGQFHDLESLAEIAMSHHRILAQLLKDREILETKQK